MNHPSFEGATIECCKQVCEISCLKGMMSDHLFAFGCNRKGKSHDGEGTVDTRCTSFSMSPHSGSQRATRRENFMLASGRYVRRASRARFLYTALLVLVPLVSARMCYVDYGQSRKANQTKSVECPEQLYGPEPGCGWSCARHKPTRTDLCTFYCFPSRHCSSEGRIRSEFEMSSQNFLQG